MIFRILVAGTGMLLVGISFAGFFKTRTHTAFKYIAFGGVTWLCTVILKFAWAVPINKHIYNLLQSYLIPEVAGPIFWIYVGLLTGIFECGGIYLLIRFSKLRNMSLSESFGFGYGFGCIEAIFLGLGQLVTIIVIASGNPLPIDFGWSMVPAPIFERIMVIFLHLYTTLLIIYSIKERKQYLFWLSFLYKSFVDVIAAWAQLSYGVSTPSHIWTVEGLIFIATFISIVGSIAFLKRENNKKDKYQFKSERT